MKKANKVILSLILVFILLLSEMPNVSISANAAESYLWPVPGCMTMSRGYYVDPYPYPEDGSHKAIDIQSGAIEGMDIVATKTGKIMHIWNTCPHKNAGMYGCNCSMTNVSTGHGNGIVIRHDDGTISSYGHMLLDSIPVKYREVGVSVAQGEIIGKVGSSGWSTGPHLDFTICSSGDYWTEQINNEPKSGQNGHNITDTAGIDYVYPVLELNNLSVTNISNTDAKISASLSYMSFVTECGFYIGTSANSLAKKIEIANSNAELIWYNLASDWQELRPGTTYYYKVYARVNGVEYQSALDSFTTTGQSYTQYRYSVVNGQAQITGYTGSGGDIIIPNTIDGYPVTSIGANAFYNRSTITNIRIPGTVKTVGDFAFRYCVGLTSVEVEAGVISIGNYAFDECSNLISVFLPDSVTSIGNLAFCACIRLEYIKLSNRITTLNIGTFQYCRSLKSIEIPNSVTTISNGVFGECSSLSSITIPQSVRYIGSMAFNNCSSLKSIALSEYVNTIDSYAFWNDKALALVVISNPGTVIGAQAFGYCDNLTICGHIISTAFNYAIMNGKAFIALEYLDYVNYWSSLNRTIKDMLTTIHIKCPVDVFVYDSNDNIVGRVVNNIIDETIPNRAYIVVNGDEKSVYLPDDDTYHIKLVATDTGVLTYSVRQENMSTGEDLRVNFYNIPLYTGKEMIGEVSKIEEYSNQNEYALKIIENGEVTGTILPDELIPKSDMDILSVSVTTDVPGTVSGSSYLTKGDYVTVATTSLN